MVLKLEEFEQSEGKQQDIELRILKRSELELVQKVINENKGKI
jgi:hypothetical protein